MLPGGVASEPGLPTFADPESVAKVFFSVVLRMA